MKILCVDDNSDITDVLNTTLNMMGHDCSSSNSGKESIELIMKNSYDVVLLDFTMPEFSGLDVIRELESMTNIPDLNIILFTAATIEQAVVDKLTQKGVKGIIKKPIEIPELEKEIKKIISSD